MGICTNGRIILKWITDKLRSIYGPTQEKGCWHPRWNSKIYSLYKYLNIVDDIKMRILGWAGQIAGMEEERYPQKALNGKFYITRSVGRPRTRWHALQILGIRGWRRRAGNREEWRWPLPRRGTQITRV